MSSNDNAGRREFMKRAALTTAALSMAGRRMAFAEATAATRPPNVVFILSDDQGSVDLGCYGSADIATPHLDELAKRGTRFRQFYVTSAMCSPSRASLLTGCYPQRVGVSSNVSGVRGLSPEATTMAEMLKAHGYRTAIFGKWHLGLLPEKSPNAQGFDEFLGYKEGCIDNYSHYYMWDGPNRHDLWKNTEEYWEPGSYFPDIMVREARRFIAANRDRPFFLYLPSNLPHFPMQGEIKWRARYEKLPVAQREYAMSVSTLDEKIGEVLAALDENGLRDNTIVLFASDNGYSDNDRNFGGGGSSGPYRGCKVQMWEGGIRMPCIVSWPGHIPRDEVRDQLATGLDWMPTIAHYCGVPLPKEKLDGVDLTPIIDSAKAPAAHEVVHWMYGKQWAVRRGDWKLLTNVPKTVTKPGTGSREIETPMFLANLAEDPGEKTDRAAEHPEIVAELTRLHEEWVKDVTPQ